MVALDPMVQLYLAKIVKLYRVPAHSGQEYQIYIESSFLMCRISPTPVWPLWGSLG
eukprot:SAG31_NODE_36126_length_316_cov_0.806452_1_plen_55_part_01